MIAQRGTILMASGTAAAPDKKHLFVVMTTPTPYPLQKWQDAVVITPICSAVGNFDTTCTLYAGDHSFIKHDSFVKYSFSVIKSAASLQSGIDAKDFSEKEMVSAGVFARMYKGMLESRRASLEVKEFLLSLRQP